MGFFFVGVCLPDDPEGNAKLMFSILDCLPRTNRVSMSIYPHSNFDGLYL